MRIRFFNSRIFSEATGGVLENVQVVVKDDRIEKIFCAPDRAVEEEIFDREIDCHGNLLMPGFKNAHTHSPMVVFRSLMDDVPLDLWLNEKIFPAEARLTADDMEKLTELAVLEYLSGGITAIFDMYLNPAAVSRACARMGMRCVNVGSVNDFTLSVPEMEQYYQTLNQVHPLISYQLGFHAEYTTSEEILRQIAALAERYHAPVYTHLAETKAEVDSCVKRTGMHPAAYLDSLGIFSYGGGGFHCVHMGREEMELFQKRALHVITNPASNLKLASGIAPVADFLELGIPVSIGTDGAASNNCMDMFKEMFLVTGLAKYYSQDASTVDAGRVLTMALSNGARAMGLADCDALSVGKKADLIMIDLHQPNMQPLHNLAKNLVYSGNKSNVVLTMIDGKILYENGTYIGADAEKIYAQAAMISKRVNGVG